MRFKQRTLHSSVPEVNLVPMMDVMMSVLTFFIITSMSLTGKNIPGITLPGVSVGVTQKEVAKPLVVGLNQQGQIILDAQPITSTQLKEAIQVYLAQEAEGTVILKADRELSYEVVVGVLKEMGTVGGNRVSLSIQRN